MLTFLHVLRFFLGLLAIWQVIGLLPVVTNWLPNLQSTTGNMWAIAFVKFVVLAASAAAYHWLGRFKKKYESPGASTSELPVIGIAVGVLLLLGFALVIALPALHRSEDKTAQSNPPPRATVLAEPQAGSVPISPSGFVVDTSPTSEIRAITPPAPRYVIDNSPNQDGTPNVESKGWTQESTGSHIFDPYKEAQAPRGTRYSRFADGTIFRFYPPGTRPDLEPANPFGLRDSTSGPPH